MISFLRRRASIAVAVILVVCVFLLGDSLKDSAQLLAAGLLVIVVLRIYLRRLISTGAAHRVQAASVFSYIKRTERARVRDTEMLRGLVGRGAAESTRNHSAVMLGIRNHEASRAKAAKLELDRINKTHASIAVLINSIEQSTPVENQAIRQLIGLYSELNAQFIESTVAIDAIHYRMKQMQND